MLKNSSGPINSKSWKDPMITHDNRRKSYLTLVFPCRSNKCFYLVSYENTSLNLCGSCLGINWRLCDIIKYKINTNATNRL